MSQKKLLVVVQYRINVLNKIVKFKSKLPKTKHGKYLKELIFKKKNILNKN